MKKRNVIVIGAGPGGLAAAMQLAHAGANVTVLESKSQVGGRCSTMPLGDFRFDVGPTFYLSPSFLHRTSDNSKNTWITTEPS